MQIHKFSDRVSVDELAGFYTLDGINLPKDRPYSWIMFVATVDGRASFMEPGKYGGDVVAMSPLRGKIKEAHGSLADWRLLQYGWAQSDAILGSASIVRTETGQKWDVVEPDILRYRRENLGKKTDQPIKVVLTARGELSLREAIFTDENQSVIIMTTDSGRNALEHTAATLGDLNPFMRNRNRVEIHSMPGEKVDPAKVAEYLRTVKGVEYLDITGGPQISGAFLNSRIVDEHRITIAPQIIGDRNSTKKERPTTIAGISKDTENAVLLELRDLGFLGSHIFARYHISKD